MSSRFNSAVEVNGVRFETVVPKKVLTIPTKQVGAITPIEFGLRVTNLSSVPYGFFYERLVPELQNREGQELRRDGGIARASQYTEADFQQLMPGESFTHLLEARLAWVLKEQFPWIEDHLRIGGIADKRNSFWSYRNFQPGVYQVRFTYKRESDLGKIYRGIKRFQVVCSNMWTGKASTPWLEFRLKY